MYLMKRDLKVIRREKDMGRRAQQPLETGSKAGKSHPASTPEEREQQLISLSYDLAEQQIRSGTASSQVLTHFLKRGSIQAELELEKLKKENALLEAKKGAIEYAQRSEELFTEAIKAMKKYRGSTDNE